MSALGTEEMVYLTRHGSAYWSKADALAEFARRCWRVADVAIWAISGGVRIRLGWSGLVLPVLVFRARRYGAGVSAYPDASTAPRLSPRSCRAPRTCQASATLTPGPGSAFLMSLDANS